MALTVNTSTPLSEWLNMSIDDFLTYSGLAADIFKEQNQRIETEVSDGGKG